METAQQLLIGWLYEDPPSRPIALGGDKMNPAAGSLVTRPGFQIHPPHGATAGQVAKVTSSGMIRQVERLGGHPLNE